MAQGVPFKGTPGNEDYLVTGEQTEMGRGCLSIWVMVNIPLGLCNIYICMYVCMYVCIVKKVNTRKFLIY